MTAHDIAKQIDAASTSLGDLTSGDPVLEFRMFGDKGKWMSKHVPEGMLVKVPGWALGTGLFAMILSALVLMTKAESARSWWQANREVKKATSDAAKVALAETALEEAADIPIAMKDLEGEPQENFRAALAVWRLAFFEWKDDYFEDNGHWPRELEVGLYVADNPPPVPGDF